MANRSYLYAKSQDGKTIGLSEYDYFIPISFLILASQNSKIVDSLIIDEKETAIEADLKQGMEKLFNFLDRVRNLNVFDENILEEQINKTKSFLETASNKYDKVQLECFELFEFGDDDFKTENLSLYNDDIMKIDEYMEETINYYISRWETINKSKLELENLIKSKSLLGFLYKKKKKEAIEKINHAINNAEAEMWNNLGINNWTHTLYYSFE